MTRFDLDGKKVLLVGAMGILGKVCAQALAAAGARIVVVDLDGDDCAAFAAQVGADALGLGVDITDEHAVDALSRSLYDMDRVPDVLINAAAAKSPNFFASLAEFPLDDWQQVMAVNVNGMFLTIRAFVPQMIAAGGGVVINVGSLYGEVGPDQRIYEGSYYEDMGGAINTPMVYSATKGAVSAMTRYIATTFGDQGIRANCLVPGGVRSGQNDTFVEKYSARVPMGRMAEAQEIADAMVYLASDASSYVNGQELIVDGGVTAW